MKRWGFALSFAMSLACNNGPAPVRPTPVVTTPVSTPVVGDCCCQYTDESGVAFERDTRLACGNSGGTCEATDAACDAYDKEACCCHAVDAPASTGKDQTRNAVCAGVCDAGTCPPAGSDENPDTKPTSTGGGSGTHSGSHSSGGSRPTGGTSRPGSGSSRPGSTRPR